MKWKKIKEEIPPLDKMIVISRYDYSLDDYVWLPGIVKRPYDRDYKYNPNYYYIIDPISGLEIDFSMEIFWMEIIIPNKREIENER